MRWNKRATLLMFFLVTFDFLFVLVHQVNSKYDDLRLHDVKLKLFELFVPEYHMPIIDYEVGHGCIVDSAARVICGGWKMEQDH